MSSWNKDPRARMPCPVSWAAEEAAAGHDLLSVPGAAWAVPPLLSSPQRHRDGRKENASSPCSSSHKGTDWQSRSGISLQLIYVNPTTGNGSKEIDMENHQILHKYIYVFCIWCTGTNEDLDFQIIKEKTQPPYFYYLYFFF